MLPCTCEFNSVLLALRMNCVPPRWWVAAQLCTRAVGRCRLEPQQQACYRHLGLATPAGDTRSHNLAKATAACSVSTTPERRAHAHSQLDCARTPLSWYIVAPQRGYPVIGGRIAIGAAFSFPGGVSGRKAGGGAGGRQGGGGVVAALPAEAALDQRWRQPQATAAAAEAAAATAT